MVNMTRDEMIKNLVNGVCLVKFIKKNGDVRLMECTLNNDIIPDDQRITEVKARSETSLPVYDVQAKGWRSFIIDNVESFGTNVESV